VRRAATAVLSILAFGAAGWGATTYGGAPAAGTDGVTVGADHLGRDVIEASARRLAGGDAGRLAAARLTAADRAIERLWLEGEAAARGLELRAGGELAGLRGAVADALAGTTTVAGATTGGAAGAPVRGVAGARRANGFARAFDAFHERWRARTRCEPAYQDPYEDRCGNLTGAAAGTCRWMGEATLCALGGGRRARWLVVQDAAAARAIRRAGEPLPQLLAARLARTGADPVTVRLRARGRAVALALDVYTAARTVRERVAATARRERAAAAAERAAAARRRERSERVRERRLSEPALVAARTACERQARDSEPYMFGFGMQDVIGGAEGLIQARSALAPRLTDAGQDGLDRRLLRPLVRAIGAGDRELVRIASAEAADDHATVAALIARFDAATAPERELARRLDLGDCLVRPAR